MSSFTISVLNTMCANIQMSSLWRLISYVATNTFMDVRTSIMRQSCEHIHSSQEKLQHIGSLQKDSPESQTFENNQLAQPE